MKNKKGFTLVELLAVIVVLAIVMLVVADRVGDAMLKSRGNSLALQVKSLNREVEKIGAMDNQITTSQIDEIITSGDLKYWGYIKAGTGNFDNDVIVVQAKEGSKFANISFTKDIEDLGTFIAKVDIKNNSVNLGDNNVKDSKAWLREPILYFKTTVPIGDTKVGGTANFTTVIPVDSNGTEGEDQPVAPKNPTKTYAVGEEITIGSEKFNVIKDDGNIVTMLAKFNLTLDGKKQDSVQHFIAFADKITSKNPNSDYGYWTDDNGYLLSQYGGDSSKQDLNYGYPVNIYDSNSKLYDIVEKYVSLLNTKKGNGTDITGRLFSFNEWFDLYVKGNGKWIANGQYWWGSTAISSQYVHIYSTDGDNWSYSFWEPNCGIRPIIEIKKSAL